MATEKQIKTRLQQKHDVEANWKLATNFIPKDGELIIYDPDNTHPEQRIKIGDGSTKINNLPFYNYISIEDVDEICGQTLTVATLDEVTF